MHQNILDIKCRDVGYYSPLKEQITEKYIIYSFKGRYKCIEYLYVLNHPNVKNPKIQIFFHLKIAYFKR